MVLGLYVFILNRAWQCWTPIMTSTHTSIRKLHLLCKQGIYVWIDSRKNPEVRICSTSDLEDVSMSQ